MKASSLSNYHNSMPEWISPRYVQALGRVESRSGRGPFITALLGLVLKCYELRTRQHNNRLKVNALRPSKHYFPKDIMIFGRRL
jgi:hypothetical protein